MAGAKTALVLGGGGPLGVVWQAELLESWGAYRPSPQRDPPDSLRWPDPLSEARIIGTSAGAIVGAHLAVHGSLRKLAALEEELDENAGKPKLARFFLAYLKARLLTRDTLAFRRSLGRSARRAAVGGEAEWIDRIRRTYAQDSAQDSAEGSADDNWPREQALSVTVVDADSGEFHAWDAQSGVPFSLAVAASCSMPCVYPLVHHGGRAYMDGGIGSSTNALLAANAEQVLVLDPLGRMFKSGASPLDGERAALASGGSRTLAFSPDEGVAKAVGRNFFDLSRRDQVVAATRLQAESTADAVWSFLART